MSQSLYSYLFISSALLVFGLFGLLTRRNLVAILISLELVLNSAGLNFLAFNKFCFLEKSAGQVFVIFIIALAAAEVCIGLSLILLLYKDKETINVDEAQTLKG